MIFSNISNISQMERNLWLKLFLLGVYRQVKGTATKVYLWIHLSSSTGCHRSASVNKLGNMKAISFIGHSLLEGQWVS